jgi:poly-gamma-glutamate biosynthesis protein PgsC/CapC
MILSAFGLGIFIGFLFFELTGLTAGGIVVPGYLALFVQQPGRIGVTVLLALIAAGLVHLLQQRLIIFGRRRFLLAILFGFVLRLGADSLQWVLPETGMDLQAIGYIIPGLIANEFLRQGVLKTFAGMAVVSAVVYFLLQLIYF